MRSDKNLKRWYNTVNKKFFFGALPSNVCVRYANEDDRDEDFRCDEKFYGWADTADGRHKYVIVISKIKNPGPVAKLATLAHEMIHCATNLRDDHGAAFSDWHEKLTERGLFRKNAILHGLTLF